MVAASPEKAGTIAGTADSDGNFARFAGYCRDIETGFRWGAKPAVEIVRIQLLVGKDNDLLAANWL